MDNATRRELLYKARAAGYPGSILDVYANYAQGRDLIAEFQQQQQMQQAQQMSDMAAQQSGMQMPQQQMQQPQQQMQPQMPVVPSSPTPAPNFTPPQPPAPIGVQSQNSPMGMVSGQSGPNQGRAIFATGGFKKKDPNEPTYVYSKNDPAYQKYLRDKAYYDKQKAIYDDSGERAVYQTYDDLVEEIYNNAKAYNTKFDPNVGLAYSSSDEGYAFKKPTPVILEKESNPKAIEPKLLSTQPIDLKPVLQNIPIPQSTKKHPVIKSTGDAAIDKLNKELYGPGGDYFATGGFTEEDPIKDAYAAYAKNKLAQITDPRTGKLLPTNDPRAQIDLRETIWKLQPTKENPKGGTINDRRQKLGYPIGMGDNDLFVDKENFNAGDLPMSAMKAGIAGLLDNNKNLTQEGKEWVKKATSKYGIDPAVIGYFNQSAMSDSTKTLAEYAPELLVESERYSKQPIISVGKFGNQLTWAPRKGDIMTNKNVADEEGQPRVVGATNMSGVDIPKKKKATGGFKYEEGGPIEDAIKFSKNPELFAKAKAMGHNSIEEYKASNWGYGPNITNKKSIGIPKDKLYNYLESKQDSVYSNRVNNLNDNDAAALGFIAEDEKSVVENAKKIASGEFFKQAPKVTNIALTKGRFNTGTVPSNVVDALVDAANRQGVDPYTMIGVAGRESTLGTGYASNKTRNLRSLVSGWTVDDPYLPYRVNRFLADKKVPGVVSKKDFHGWDFSIQDTGAVNNYLEKHPEVINQYLKKVRNTPELNSLTTLDLAAQKIKREGIANYNPGDSRYAQMVQDDINTLKKDPELSNYLKSKGVKKLGGTKCYTCVGRKRRV